MDDASPIESVAAIPPAVDPSPATAYARLSGRVKAVLIDAAISAAVLVLLVIIASSTEDVPGTGRAFVILVIGWAVLYEPLQVWLFGGTIGHRRVNLRVVSDRTGGPPSFPVSFARFVIKGILGFPSFISMAFTRRYQAIHDLLTGTTVQLRDVSIAGDDDYLVERVPEFVTIEIPATRSRRIVVILAYVVGAYLLSGLLSVGLVSNQCLSKGDCSTIDSANSRVISLVFFAGVLAIAIQGWRGRLWGARSRLETAPLSTPPEPGEPPATDL